MNGNKCINKVLEWRSNSIYIYPKSNNGSNDGNKKRILIGTDTGMKESNYAILLQYETDTKAIHIKRKYKHTGNVLKVLGVNDSKCITASSDSNLYLYDLNQQWHEVSTKPDLMLNEHSKPCTGISLNTLNDLLLSSSEDNRVCLWDLNATGNLGILKPINIISSSSSTPKGQNQAQAQGQCQSHCINDVNWSKCNPNLFASGSNDSCILFYDKRSLDSNNNNCAYTKVNTASPITKVSFNYLNANLFISTNGDNHIVDLWDLRNTKIKLHSFKYHKDSITALRWSNTNENYFASASKDKTVVYWNIKLIEEYKSPVSTEDNPFEAIEIQRSNEKILDFDWRDQLSAGVNIDNSINVRDEVVFN